MMALLFPTLRAFTVKWRIMLDLRARGGIESLDGEQIKTHDPIPPAPTATRYPYRLDTMKNN